PESPAPRRWRRPAGPQAETGAHAARARRAEGSCAFNTAAGAGALPRRRLLAVRPVRHRARQRAVPLVPLLVIRLRDPELPRGADVGWVPRAEGRVPLAPGRRGRV